jgi:glycosyltransferase involved in cell wall biosynthesis
MPDATVMISTYNRPQHLERCLERFRHQTATDFEIVIADDGSREETAKVVRAAMQSHPERMRHAWQQDNGFHKSAILTEAVRLADSDYLIFTDGDCVPHRDFVVAHPVV